MIITHFGSRSLLPASQVVAPLSHTGLGHVSSRASLPKVVWSRLRPSWRAVVVISPAQLPVFGQRGTPGTRGGRKACVRLRPVAGTGPGRGSCRKAASPIRHQAGDAGEVPRPVVWNLGRRHETPRQVTGRQSAESLPPGLRPDSDAAAGSIGRFVRGEGGWCRRIIRPRQPPIICLYF